MECKKEALAYLESYHNGLYNNKIDLVLNIIPNNEKELFIDYIENGNKRIIHPMNIEAYEEDCLFLHIIIIALILTMKTC